MKKVFRKLVVQAAIVDQTHIWDDCKVSNHVQNLEPDPDVLSTFCNGPPGFADELLRVQSNLHPVVQQREERGKRKGGNENCDEPELQN